MEPDPVYDAFRRRLVESGVLVEGQVPGIHGKGTPFVRVFDALAALVSRSGADLGPEQYRFPPMIPREHLLATDYLRSFPDLIGSIHGFDGDERDHAAMLATAEDGGDWGAHLHATDAALLPAACYPLYPMLTGRLPDGGRLFEVVGTCFRNEPSPDPARMRVFHQHEFVHVGSPETATAHRATWMDRAPAVCESLGLDVRLEVANDPFFGRAGRMLAANQRESALKFEVLATVADADRPTAIASCNYHQDHLTVPFDIVTADGERAHSACVGFGLERISLALFARLGTDVDAWPAATRDRLWP